MKRLRWNEQKERQLWEILFLAVYAVLLAKYLLESSLVTYVIYEHVPKRDSYYLWLRLLAATIVLAKTARQERYSLWELLLAVFVLISFWRCVQVAGYVELIDLAIVVFGARGVSFQKVLTVYVTVSGILVLAILTGSLTGYLGDWQFERWIGETVVAKHSFGFYYPNEFGAHVFFFFLSLSCLRKEKISVLELFLMVICSIFLWKYCYARTNAVCIILLAIAMFVWRMLAQKMQSSEQKQVRILAVVLALVPLICCIIMLVLSVAYSSDSEVFVRINGWLSKRLSLSQKAFTDYGITLFGQYIEMVGMALDTDWANYNFLDCSYISILVRFGIASFVSIGLLMARINIRAYRKRDIVLLFVMALCGVQCMMEHHLYDIAYNPLLLAAFAVLPDMRGTEKEVAEKQLCTEERVKAG